MREPVPITEADVLVVESTYGDRLHSDAAPADELAEVINRTTDRQGTVVIPAFAVGRTQAILHLLSELRQSGRIPKIPTYLNSPMAINATEIYCNHAGEHRLSESECSDMFDVAEMVRSPEASRALNTNDGPTVIISASGMATGGRVVHHLKTLLPDPRNTVMFAGFQAPGTRGSTLVGGAEEVRIHGRDIPVRAEVVSLDGLSAHADYREMISWLRSIKSSPRRVFITHGQIGPAESFRQHLQEQLGWQSEIPDYRDEVEV
jgi:metallo-beta-lactamase family protein